MFDDGSNLDVLAGDNIYTCQLPFYNNGEVVKFYVRAQNDNAMQLIHNVLNMSFICMLLLQ